MTHWQTRGFLAQAFLWGLILTGLGFAAPAAAQSSEAWVFFTERPPVPPAAQPALSERALARRARQGVPLDVRDYALPANRLDSLRQTGARVLGASRWLNAAWCRFPSSAARAAAAGLPYVARLRGGAALRAAGASDELPDYGASFGQLDMIGLPELHEQGYNGAGVVVAVFDNGFQRANQNPAFQKIFAENRLLAARDFVNEDDETYDQGRHGARMFSIIAAESPGQVIGSAYGATFLLCRTENDDIERLSEEFNWVRAAEWADSAGAAVFTTSLNYHLFDVAEENHAIADLDGDTAPISVASDVAAAKGILVAASAGNEGNAPWRYITPPADADSILAVGAVTSARELADLSGVGGAMFERIKPDLVAQGMGVRRINTNGSPGSGFGTSNAAPLVAGLSACLLQAEPNAPGWLVREAILRSCDRYATPDTLYGHGIPNAAQALAELRLLLDLENPASDAAPRFFPNPATTHADLVWAPENPEAVYSLEFTDAAGRTVFAREWKPADDNGRLRLTRAELPLASGLYVFRLRDASGAVRWTKKFVWATE